MSESTYRSSQGRGSVAYVVLLASVAALGGLLFGYDTAVIAGAIGLLQERFGLTPFGEGFAAASALAGCVLGAGLGGFISDRLGRKKVLALAAAAFLVSAIGTALPRSFAEFLVFRFLGGVGIGAASITSPMYIAEITPHRLRGRMISINQFAIVSGMLIVYFVNYLISQYGDSQDALHPGELSWNVVYGWRWMFGSGIAPSLLFMALLFVVPESPRWLTRRGRENEAFEILARISGGDEALLEMDEIRSGLAKEVDGQGLVWWWALPGAVLTGGMVGWLFEWPLNDTELVAVAVAALVGAMAGATFAWLGKVIVESPLRVAAVLGIALAVLQQITGVNVFLYFAPEIFKSLGATSNVAMMQTVVVGAVNMAFTILAMGTVDRWGRKPLMLVGAAGMGVSLVALGLGAYLQSVQWWALVFMLGYIACFAMSVGPVTWVILAEIFPTAIRGRAMGGATICLWLANFFVSLTFPWMDQNEWLVSRFHHAFPFWVYAVFCGVLFAVVLCFVPETKGKTLEEIERRWLRGWRSGPGMELPVDRP